MDLKTYLKINPIRQQEFAAAVGCTQGYVSRVVARQYRLGGSAVLKWAAATQFEVTPHDLRPDLYPNPRDGIPEQTTA